MKLSIPVKEKDRHAESRSLPLRKNTPNIVSTATTHIISRTATSPTSTTPITPTTNDSFFSVDFFSKLLKKK